MSSHVVTSPAVQVTAGGRAYFLERGAVLPEGVAADVIEHLLANDLIEAAERPDDELEGNESGAPKRPRGNAGLARWVEYAQELGHEVPEDADIDAVKALVDAPAGE